MTAIAAAAPYALVFKTHAWDPFIARQLARYVARVGAGHVVVVVDETNGAVGDIPHPHVIRTTAAELLGLGLAGAYPKGGLIWWNTDYPNILAFLRLPAHPHYVFVEYDSCITMDIDVLVARVAEEGSDFVALPTRQDQASWYWTKPHERTYPLAEMGRSLNCICILSHRGMALLAERRRAMTIEHEAGRVPFWPGNEVFCATEILRAGYRFTSLERFGDASRYEWHPPILEADLTTTTGDFLHPVLDQARYIASVLKFEFDLSSYFDRRSPLRRTLSRFPAAAYVPRMPGAFRRQLMVKVRQALGAI